jgi:hypothetical protein
MQLVIEDLVCLVSAANFTKAKLASPNFAGTMFAETIFAEIMLGLLLTEVLANFAETGLATSGKIANLWLPCRPI